MAQIVEFIVEKKLLFQEGYRNKPAVFEGPDGYELVEQHLAVKDGSPPVIHLLWKKL
jgi:hypothetical protein